MNNYIKELFWDNCDEMISFLGFAIITVFVIIAGIGLGSLLSKVNCQKAYQDYNPHWGIISGCRIEWQGKLTPVDMIKNINI